MKILQSPQKYLAMLGVSSNQSLKNVNFFVAAILCSVRAFFDSMYLVCVANTFREYTYGTLYSSSTMMAAVCFTMFAANKKHLFKLITIGEELIENSELILYVEFFVFISNNGTAQICTYVPNGFHRIRESNEGSIVHGNQPKRKKNIQNCIRYRNHSNTDRIYFPTRHLCLFDIFHHRCGQ